MSYDSWKLSNSYDLSERCVCCEEIPGYGWTINDKGVCGACEEEHAAEEEEDEEEEEAA